MRAIHTVNLRNCYGEKSEYVLVFKSSLEEQQEGVWK